MKARAVGYWICTALIAFAFLSGGVVDVMRPQQALEGMTHLGYPPYFMIILGVWKILGGVVILLPGFALPKEWAYAGMIFDLTGASASHFATGDDVRHIVVPLVLAVLVVASWALRPESRRLKRA
ncbi:MAG TPA: DoxX family protein [Thermoanaerobaculia bacterium]|nr:DoxX family protein [Thermoanaerobaculia bacterium]